MSLHVISVLKKGEESMMYLRICLNILLLLLVISPGHGQMAEWKFFRDSEGNRYYIDAQGKIWTSSEPEYKYKPISIEGMEYYINHGNELIKNQHYVEGLTILKSICSMQADNNIIRTAQLKAGEIINNMKKVQGNRYDSMNEDASILLYRKDGNVFFVNDVMMYSFVFSGNIQIIRKKIRARQGYRYVGVSLGILSGSEEPAEGPGVKFSILLSCDSERYTLKVADIAGFETTRRKELGYDGLVRNPIKQSEKLIVYRITSRIKPFHEGFEVFAVNRTFGHMFRLITPAGSFDANKKIMEDIINGFKVID